MRGIRSQTRTSSVRHRGSERSGDYGSSGHGVTGDHRILFLFFIFFYFFIIIRIMHNAGYNNSTQLTKELYPRIQVSTIHITTHNTT